jgi:CRP-like cAMP-binding protein
MRPVGASLVTSEAVAGAKKISEGHFLMSKRPPPSRVSTLPLDASSARERVAHVLLALAPLIGQKSPDGIELDVTNQELADSTNISPYTTSRLINEWQRTGALRKRRGKIFLGSLERFSLRVA